MAQFNSSCSVIQTAGGEVSCQVGPEDCLIPLFGQIEHGRVEIIELRCEQDVITVFVISHFAVSSKPYVRVVDGDAPLDALCEIVECQVNVVVLIAVIIKTSHGALGTNIRSLAFVQLTIEVKVHCCFTKPFVGKESSQLYAVALYVTVKVLLLVHVKLQVKRAGIR